MARRWRTLAVAACMLAASSAAQAQSTEQRFNDLFITAGYSAAFGATLGLAALSFAERPEKHLNWVAVGASLGFIGGSVMGSYIVFSPLVATTPEPELPQLAGQSPRVQFGASLGLTRSIP